MSGHSKWNNIKRKKEKTDGQRAKIFTKIGREMTVCVKSGGGDPNVNGKLRDLIAKAKSMNVPNDNIQRIIKKAEGGEKDAYESITYEGYGPSGIAMIVETLTDNRNRTAGNLRHYFDKFGGNLGNTGCVSFLFAEQGVIVLDVEGKNEEIVMEDAFDAGAEDFDMSEDIAEITTSAADFSAVREALERKGYSFISADIAMVPSTQTALTDPDDIKKMGILLDALEDDDDVQDVWHNLENEEDLDR
ncbi:MAG: YebC/PmpR family DNA-binding transcriptional regulator [Ruthenibacterium sp.]